MSNSEGLPGRAQQQAGEVAAVVGERARGVVGTVQDQAAGLGQEAVEQARDLLGEVRDRVRAQVDNRFTELGARLRAVADGGDALQRGRPEEAGAAGEWVGAASQQVRSIADALDRRGVDGSLQQLREYGRRRPGMFLAGAALAGFGVARLLRSGAAGGASSGSGASGSVTSSAQPGVTGARGRDPELPWPGAGASAPAVDEPTRLGTPPVRSGPGVVGTPAPAWDEPTVASTPAPAWEQPTVPSTPLPAWEQPTVPSTPSVPADRPRSSGSGAADKPVREP